MSDRAPLHLFEAFGVELEYMLVDAETLDVRPIVDQVLHAVNGDWSTDAELGDISWSNELALHVIELKTTDPVPTLDGLSRRFDEHVRRIGEIASGFGARLMPTAMHPWMDPTREMRLWPHEYNAVYEAFDRIFDCRGHGWANLQSMHINLPFAGDDEFGRLHAAIRVLLPILPALAASSPLMDGRLTGSLDTRLDVYRGNARRIPSISGHVIPEPVFTAEEYQREIFDRIYRDIAPFDPDGTLQHEWLNARGAIARFDRNAIEIRVLDVQECPAADVAIAAAIVAVLRGLVEERWSTFAEQKQATTDALAAILSRTTHSADAAVIADPAYLHLFARTDPIGPTAHDLWRSLLEEVQIVDSNSQQSLAVLTDHGPLARRILRRLAGDESSRNLHKVYAELTDCLAEGRMFGT